LSVWFLRCYWPIVTDNPHVKPIGCYAVLLWILRCIYPVTFAITGVVTK